MNRKRPLSTEAYNEALKYIPGGVNSPVRAMKCVEENPLFIRKARGAYLMDIDGNRYTDFCMSWGVFILGHSHPFVIKAASRAITNGTSYGAPTLQETALAKEVCTLYPGIEKVRFVNSGTEAVMSAIRLARGYTRRNLIVKFDGCYHGHADHLLIAAGSGAANLCDASSAGVPESFTAHTISLPFNDKEAVNELFEKRGSEIAAIIVEPVPANMGVVLPQNNFLHFLREITARYGSLLIFDEVITGFRLSIGGAQQLFDITPDLTTLGKIIGGGFPAAAFGGKAEIMNLLAPDGDVYQAGTLSGNPAAISAGIETIRLLKETNFHRILNSKADDFLSRLAIVMKGKGATVQHIGSMFTIFFTNQAVNSFADAKKADQRRFGEFFRYMLANKFYLSPSQFEADFLSISHSNYEMERFLYVASKFQERTNPQTDNQSGILPAE
ncbi:MAG: glutamate-1-semialdehyde 2,1-aminomutase [Prevotella sp.]|jgi:glutamate-1-semialdehyde 2,1-aminomutase|nr:glutamate-1-semialdehyde 2,1-aminomutase [Prevotella sp.]